MNVIQKLDQLLSGRAAPVENMARPPRQPQTVEGPGTPNQSSGNLAGAINAGEFGPPSRKSPMDRVLHRPPPPPNLLEGVPFPSPAQTRAFDADLADNCYERPEDVLAQLKELDAPFNRLQAACAECARSQHPKYQEHIGSIARRTAEGDATVHQEDGWTREDWEADARERLNAFKGELNLIQSRAWAIAEPALLAKANFLDARADEIEETVRRPFDKFCAPYHPPSYVLLMRKYAATLRDGSRRTAGLPSSMLETL